VIDLAAIDDSRRLLMQFAAQFDAPAYVRRAREVERARALLLESCRRHREQWLEGIRWRLPPILAAVVDSAGRSGLSRDSLAALEQLRLAAGVDRSSPPAGRVSLPRLLRGLRASVERFNRRWLRFLDGLDLAAINRLREDYNRYYLLEKECAVGSAQLAALTFQRLDPLTTADVLAHFPALPLP
jgi:hypothetical protein